MFLLGFIYDVFVKLETAGYNDGDRIFQFCHTEDVYVSLNSNPDGVITDIGYGI